MKHLIAPLLAGLFVWTPVAAHVAEEVAGVAR